jgi:transcriptional regulator with XRE-family HTH domain
LVRPGEWTGIILRGVDDQRVGAVLRKVRLRRGWRQADLADAVGVHRSMVSRVERGHLGDHTFGAIRAMAAALDVRLDLVPRWRGGDLERLLNAGHSQMHEQLATYLVGLVGWQALPEVSFSVYGERGIVDILCWHASRRAVLVVEIKTDIVDINELLGTLDRKRRLAPRIAAERGWDPLTVGVWLTVAESSTNRRRVEAHRTVLRAALPMDGRAVQSWLREPSSSMAGLSFWSGAHWAHVDRRVTTIRRVRRSSAPPPERSGLGSDSRRGP